MPEATSAAVTTISPVEVLPAETPQDRYQRLRDEGRRLVEAGCLERALEALDQALGAAEESGDEGLVALARCNRAAVTIQLGYVDDPMADLRSVLMRNFNAETSFAAAYNLSVAYELKKDPKKALFYGRIARDRSLAVGSHDYLAKSHHQIAGGLYADSHFEAATAEYGKVLELLPEGMSEVRAMAMTNLAYCKLVDGRWREAFRNLFACLRWYRKVGQRLYLPWPHLMLCFGYLEMGRLRRAWRHGRRALELSEAMGNFDAIKSSLFLLGEVEKVAGDHGAAYEYLTELQRRFYPDCPSLPPVVAQLGMSQLVNFGA